MQPIVDAGQVVASLGAREIPREQFLQIVAESASQPAPDWRSVDIGFPTV